MEHTVNSRYRRSPPTSSDRLLGIFAFSPSPPSSATSAVAGGGGGGDELNEAELFYAAGEASELENHRSSFSPSANTNLRRSFNQNFGILAALPESDYSQILRRKPSPTTTMAIPSIPRPSGDGYFTQSVPGGGGGGGRRFQQSAPMKVPVVPPKARRNAGDLAAVDDGDDDGDDYEMLPPHEIVARSSGGLPNATSFSVLEGVGRTLKGRDLRQVRNAIWRKTGFLD